MDWKSVQSKKYYKSDSQKSCTIHVSGNPQRNHLRLNPHRRADHCNRAWYPGQRLHRYLRHPCQRRIPQTWLCPSDLHRTSERRNEKRCTECISSGCRGKWQCPGIIQITWIPAALYLLVPRTAGWKRKFPTWEIKRTICKAFLFSAFTDSS